MVYLVSRVEGMNWVAQIMSVVLKGRVQQHVEGKGKGLPQQA